MNKLRAFLKNIYFLTTYDRNVIVWVNLKQFINLSIAKDYNIIFSWDMATNDVWEFSNELHNPTILFDEVKTELKRYK